MTPKQNPYLLEEMIEVVNATAVKLNATPHNKPNDYNPSGVDIVLALSDAYRTAKNTATEVAKKYSIKIQQEQVESIELNISSKRVVLPKIRFGKGKSNKRIKKERLFDAMHKIFYDGVKEVAPNLKYKY